MKKHLLLLLALALASMSGYSQVQITELGQDAVIDFTGFAATGYSATPTAGQLNSNNWAMSGLTEAPLEFGQESSTEEMTRGLTDGSGVNAGGLYAFDDGSNQMLWIQPTAAVFTPGELILKVCNNSGEDATSFDISYDITVLNDGERGNNFNFSHSLDNENFIIQPVLDFVSEELPDSAITTTEKVLGSIAADIADGDCLYLKWSGGDLNGSGTRDEFGLDNILVRMMNQGAEDPSAGFPPVPLSTPEGTLSQIFIHISEPADCDYEVIILEEESTATELEDFELLTPIISFTADNGTTETLKIQTVDDLIVEEDETIAMEFHSLTPGCAVTNASTTFTIENNDFEGSSLADVIQEDADGIGLALGEELAVQGVVHGINLNAFGVQFTIMNEEGGIRVINNTSTFGYVVEEGDDVIVSGVVGQDKGLTILQAVSIVKSSSGAALSTVTTVTEMSEETESQMIKMENLTIVNPEVWNSPMEASGFEVIVNDGTNNHTMFISSQSDIFGTAPPASSFKVTGIGGQVDPTAPFLSGYRIEPRYLSDFEFSAPQPVSIGFALSNLEVNEDAGTLPLTVNLSPNNTGSDIQVDATVSALSSATEGSDFTLENTSFTVSPGNSDSAEILLNIIDDLDNEATETVIIELSLSSGGANAVLTNELLEINISDNDPVSVEDAKLFSLQTYPNPVSDRLFVSSEADLDLLELVNLSGQVLISTTNLQDQAELDVSHLPAGIYLLNAFINGQIVTEKIVKQ